MFSRRFPLKALQGSPLCLEIENQHPGETERTASSRKDLHLSHPFNISRVRKLGHWARSGLLIQTFGLHDSGRLVFWNPHINVPLRLDFLRDVTVFVHSDKNACWVLYDPDNRIRKRFILRPRRITFERVGECHLSDRKSPLTWPPKASHNGASARTANDLSVTSSSGFRSLALPRLGRLDPPPVKFKLFVQLEP